MGTWNDLTFVECSLLTADKMTRLQGNFAALAAQDSGAPLVTFPNSPATALQATGASSLETLEVGSGIRAPEVSSFGSVEVGSGVRAPEVSSFGGVEVGSGVRAPEVSSFGTVVTQHGYQSVADTTSLGVSDTEKVILTVSIDARGNNVVLPAYARVTNEAGVNGTWEFRVRVGSLGGAELDRTGHTSVGGRQTSLALHAAHAPSSGPASYVLTMRIGTAGNHSVVDRRLTAFELPQ